MVLCQQEAVDLFATHSTILVVFECHPLEMGCPVTGRRGHARLAPQQALVVISRSSELRSLDGVLFRPADVLWDPAKMHAPPLA